MWLPRKAYLLFLSPGHSGSLGIGFLVPHDKFSPLGFLLLKPLGNSFKVLLVT